MADAPTIPEIKAAVHEVLEEQRKNFWVPAEKHYLHHKQMDKCINGMPEGGQPYFHIRHEGDG